MGYRDMALHATLVDGTRLRRIMGPDIEVFEMLRQCRSMEVRPESRVRAVVDNRTRVEFVRPVPDSALETGVRMYLAVMEKVTERGYEAVSLVDVDGVKKLLHFPPAAAAAAHRQGGVAPIPENDGLGAVTQLIVRYLTGQVGAYLEFYEVHARPAADGRAGLRPVGGRGRLGARAALAGLRRAEGRHPEHLQGEDRPCHDLPSGQPWRPLHDAHRHR